MENQQLNYLEEFKEFPLNNEYKVSNLGNVLSNKGRRQEVQRLELKARSPKWGEEGGILT